MGQFFGTNWRIVWKSEMAKLAEHSVISWCQENQCFDRLMHGLNTIKAIAAANGKMREGLTEKLIRIPVYKNERLVSCAGKAHFRERKISLHPALYDKDDPVYTDRFDTFFHELAHFTAYWYFGDGGHNMWWQICMVSFGLNPSRCYDPHKFNYRGHAARQADRLLGDVEIEL